MVFLRPKMTCLTVIIKPKEVFIMMISPQEFEDDLKTESLENIIKIKNSLIRKIKYFEKNKDMILAQDIIICPSQEVVYKMNLLYLDVCNKLIRAKTESKNVQ